MSGNRRAIAGAPARTTVRRRFGVPGPLTLTWRFVVENAEGVVPQALRLMPSRLLNLAALLGNRHTDRVLSELNARRYHFALLSALIEFGPASQADLGRRTGIDRSDVVATVNELAERGYVQRRADADDRRRNIIALTAAGRRRHAALEQHLAIAQEDLLKSLTDAERERLVRLLIKVVDSHT